MGMSNQLHDDNEEFWPTKVHVGCGNVYLKGYINVDIAGLPAVDHPEIVEANITTIDDYYGRLEKKDNQLLPERHETVVDEFMNMTKLKFPIHSIDKIVAIQSFEHITPMSAWNALIHWWGLLKDQGVVIISVPEMVSTIDMLEKPETREFAIRHIKGSRRDQFNFHQAWYTYSSLMEMMVWAGFEVNCLSNFHVYPAIVFEGYKGRRDW